MFLADPGTGRLAAVSDQVMRAHEAERAGEEIEQELFLQQIETTSLPHDNLEDLHTDLLESRRRVAAAAESAGAAIAAVAAPVLAHEPAQTTPKDRYRTMVSDFGEVGRRALVCATHVHVEVGDEEAITVLDGLRPWLPILLALSCNSPFDGGADTGYASWRSQVWEAWPSAGPVEPFGDMATYRQVVQSLIESGAALDEGMVYFDVRVAQDFPTVEIRVADVCTDLEDTLLIAELARALVETVASRGPSAAPWRVELLRAARWRARRHGLTGTLIDPLSMAVVPARQVAGNLLDHVRPALVEAGTASLVEKSLESLFSRGTGSERQRRVAGADQDLPAVVADILARTRSSYTR